MTTDSVYDDIPVYALSANAMNNEVSRGKEAGFKDYLTKPLDVAQFSTILNNFDL
jgi:CheY-like chemotaxis protein